MAFLITSGSLTDTTYLLIDQIVRPTEPAGLGQLRFAVVKKGSIYHTN